jgi:hypothetical protein
MLVRRVTPERRAQLARQALKEIEGFRARLALREQLAPLGVLDLLAFKVCRAWLDRWERRERQALKACKE